MDEIVPHLWIGDLPSALDVDTLKTKKIFSVVTAMRGKITIHAVRSLPFQNTPRCYSPRPQTFNKYQINIDDSEDEDVLVHFLPSISFIQKELDKSRGVLVHCQAGLSESSGSTYSVETNRLQAEVRLSSQPT